jgi:hypothetical protein
VEGGEFTAHDFAISLNTVIASASEAIHMAMKKKARMDCFVARAPRNDG